MELMNPDWLTSTPHHGVRLDRSPDGTTVMEVDHRLPDGSLAVQVVAGWQAGMTLRNCGNS